MPSKHDQYFSKTLEKGLLIINLFGRENSSRSLTEIVTLTGIDKISTYRLVNTLIQLGYLDSDALDSYFATLAPVKMLPHTLVDIEDIRADITATKTRGYSINNMEYITGVVSIGAPMMNLTTKSVGGAVSLDFPSKDYPLEVIEQQYNGMLLTLAVEASDLITNAGIRR